MAENTKTDALGPQNIPRYVWIILALLTVFVYLFGLTIPFLGPDETRYAQVAREMFDRSDWVTTTLGGFSWFEKPALLYWLQIASYSLFGVNEFAARLGPALFGLGTITSLWLIGRAAIKSEISNLNFEITSRDFPNWLALISASSLGIIVFSRGASFDIIITFPLTAALVSFFIFDQSVEATFKKRYLPLTLFYVFIGLSLLAKGLIGIVFPFAIVGFYYLLSRRFPRREFILSLYWGTLLAAAIAATWYLPMYLRHGYAFIDEFFVQHHFQRFTSNKYRHPQPFYFFLWVLPLMTLPWLPFFFASLWKLTKNLFLHFTSSPRLRVTPSPLQLFATAWLIVPLAFFSFSGSKLPGYILPSVPAAIILTAVFVCQLAAASNKWRNAVLVTAVSTFASVFLLLTFALPHFAETDSVKTLIQTSNERGYAASRVLMLHTVSHNAEFYAAGRLLRDTTGMQRKFYSVNEILPALEAETGRQAIILVPLQHLSLLTRDERITTDVLKDNGELAVAIVTAK